MLSLAHPSKYYQLFLCQGVGMGIGAGFLYLPAMAIQSHHWNKKRPLAMGLVISGVSTPDLEVCDITSDSGQVHPQGELCIPLCSTN